MATKTSTETRREITKKGDVITVKVMETITTCVPGKDPEVKEITRVEEFKGKEGLKRLPDDIRRQLEQPNSQGQGSSLNKNPTRGNFAEECLAEHNKYRKIHGAEPLKLSQELIAISEKRARELAGKDEMTSRTDQTYGESLSCLWSNDPEHFVKPSEIISRWYSEHKNYDFSKEPTNLNAGHFTQLVWGNTKEFGIAAAKSDSNRIYVVATYSPPGNYIGEFKKNVLSARLKAKIVSGLAGLAFGFPKISSSRGHAKVSTIEIAPEDLNKESVKIHNEYRARHGVPPLRYSKELARYAQEWAEELAREDKFEHRVAGKYGENLYCFRSSDAMAIATAADACKNWYGEIRLYDFNSEPKTLITGHFTQMVWKGTMEVGMGRAKSSTGMQVIVANYNPPGNYVGNYRANVPKPKK